MRYFFHGICSVVTLVFLVIIVNILEGIKNPEHNRYKMYRTENMYTFLQLDTASGLLKQIQWTLEGKNEGSFDINTQKLIQDEPLKTGRFELYATKNMYTFILLDKINGNVFHAQWGMEENNRLLYPIFGEGRLFESISSGK